MKRILYIGNHLAKKSKYNSTLDVLSQLLRNEGFEVVISSDKQNKVIRLLDMCFSFFRYRRNIDIMLIDTFSTTNFYYAYILSQLARVFKIAYIPILHGGDLPSRLKRSPKMANKIFNNSLINISPSEYLKSAFESQGYKTSVIPNTIEVKDYKFKVRKEFSPKLLWVRAFDKTYNPLMAIRVLKELKEKYTDVRLCMIGPQKDETLELTKQLIEEFNLEDSVEITGVLPKEEWHKKSEEFDIFINTTNFDNMPVSVIEAMALGLPVVSTNVGGIPFLIDDLQTGVLVKPNDTKEMVNSIVSLMNNTNSTIEMTKNARIKVENYDWKVVRNDWLKVLS